LELRTIIWHKEEFKFANGTLRAWLCVQLLDGPSLFCFLSLFFSLVFICFFENYRADIPSGGEEFNMFLFFHPSVSYFLFPSFHSLSPPSLSFSSSFYLLSLFFNSFLGTPKIYFWRPEGASSVDIPSGGEEEFNVVHLEVSSCFLFFNFKF
jgi:hypothetical protein